MPGYDFLVSFEVPWSEVPVGLIERGFEDVGALAITDTTDKVTFTLALTTCVSAEAGAWLMQKLLFAAESHGLPRGLSVDVLS